MALFQGRSVFRAIAAAVAIGLNALTAASGAEAAGSAIVVVYNRFGEEGTPSNNIRLDQFEAHLAEIAEHDINVLPIPEILAALRDGRELPQRTIGISIDDAYLSVYTRAWPRLREAGLPFTLFVATNTVDGRDPGYMSWDQIRALAENGVTIGSQAASGLHMPLVSRERNAREIVKSNQRFEDELGRRPRLFAFPYGEMSLKARDVVIEHGFIAAVGQHSGVLHQGSRFYYLPRFTMNEAYSNVARFRLAANALPIQIRDVTPLDPLLDARANPPSYGFTVYGEALARIGGLTCYASGQGKARIERLGAARVEVRLKKRLAPGRARINCTMPGSAGRWHWHGTLFYMPHR